MQLNTMKDILLYLQNMKLSDGIQEPMCKELLKEVNRITLNADYISEDAESSSLCKPKSHIFFLKTHKTASSTIMNILFRFGETRNLTFAFPSNNMAQFYYPGYFAASQVEGFSEENYKTFHIMCHHMRFQLTEVEKVMPNDTFYFTILRNPVSLMESSFSYYKGTQSFSRAKSLEDFMNNTSKFYKFSNNYAKNCMTFDLGYDHNGQESTEHFKLIQQAVKTTFDLVLITEYFDESLVLLKNALCWTFDDVLSFPLNSRSNNTKMSLSPETQDKIKSWNQLDWQLYVYFNRSFWDQVHKFGKERMKHEVTELRRRRAEMSETCLLGEVGPEDIRDKSLRPFQYGMAKIIGYNLKSGLGVAEQLLCRRLVTPELQYSDLLRVKQQQRTKKTPKK
ncbi:galactose-3-O-sulfotransferase 4-like [Spea bombifrons]|uniref:galactose-3-O-sulfotransferase 4-like n=1 Tax=Spea bombifrons TaxID=233779 RepID=UPI00234959DE|nr:galactose-3-O-sulfotransferase 4-like [Spea bombifrons]